MRKNEILRLYYVHIVDDDCGLGVVARTVGEPEQSCISPEIYGR